MSAIINLIAMIISTGALLIFILIIPIFSNRAKIKNELRKTGFEEYKIHFPAKGVLEQSPKSGIKEAAFFIYKKNWRKVSSPSTIKSLKINRYIEIAFYSSFILMMMGVLALVAIEFL